MAPGLKIIAAMAVSSLVAAPYAAAAEPSISGYASPAGQTQQQIAIPTPPPAPTPPKVNRVAAKTETAPVVRAPAPQKPVQVAQPTAAKLPFTGLDLAMLAAAGCALMVMGFGIRQITRPEAS